jgi:sugar-specific transcriptional regulator TrmB
MINHSIFKSFGLSDKEIAVYLSSLSNTDSSASDIEKNTGIGRTYIYDIAQKLIEKKFLTQINKNKKRVFNAVSPKEILENQKKLVFEFEDNIEELEELQKTSEDKPKIVYYSGKKELAAMHENFISSKIDKEAIAFSDDSFYVKNEGYYQKREIDKRLKEGVHFRAIAGMSTAVLASQKKDKEEDRETRIIPKDIFDINTAVGVHGHKTVVINNKKPFGFVVEDEDLANTIKQIFELVWNSGRVVK